MQRKLVIIKKVINIDFLRLNLSHLTNGAGSVNLLLMLSK